MSTSKKKRLMHDTETVALASPQPTPHLNENPNMSICNKQKLVHDSEPLALGSPQSSRFLKLPGELRNMIYKLVFGSTRLSYGLPGLAYFGPKCTKPAPHSLSLLYTCRAIHQEVRVLWINHVLFNFTSAEMSLVKLHQLPATTMTEIRHLRIPGEIYYLKSPLGSYCATALGFLLPHLRLETLTVLGAADEHMEYETLNALIKGGIGWKELHFISRDSCMLGRETMWVLANIHGSLLSAGQAQLQVWNEEIQARDGKDSGASVCIYRSTLDKAPGSVTKPNCRELFSPMSLEDARQIKTCPGYEKEFPIIVKRGRNADISKPGCRSSVYLREGLHNFPVEVEIEASGECSPSATDKEEIDAYADVDDLVWLKDD